MSKLLLVKNLSNIIDDKWQIRARINKKGKIVTHAKGQLFKIDLIDDQDNSTMIEGTFYTEETTYFYTQLEEGRTYLISDAVIDVANKKFTSIKHDYRLIFKMHT